MYLITNSANLIVEICEHPCYVRKQANGVVVLSEQDKCSTVHRNCVIPAAERRAKTLIVTVPMLCFVGRCSVHTAEIA